MLAGERFHLVVVNLFLGISVIGNDVEPLARHIQGHTVREVVAFGQTHTQNCVARFLAKAR